MRIYLDASCLNRPFDDQRQDRLRLEAEAVRLILDRCDRGAWRHVSSVMAALEIDASPDADKRRKARALLPRREDIMGFSPAVFARADALMSGGSQAPIRSTWQRQKRRRQTFSSPATTGSSKLRSTWPCPCA